MPFIDLSEKELDKSIYRYTDFYRVVQMFKNKEMTFVQPKKWDDPFENYIIDPNIKFADGAKLFPQYKSVIHGSCWTRKSVSDAMWRLYSPHKMSVRIKTTPRILSQAIDSALKKYNNSIWNIGKVQYLPQHKIIKLAESLALGLVSNEKDIIATKSLLLKRISFSHEQEIRVLIIDRHSRSKNGILKIPINPHNVIQSILIDSRAPNEILDIYKTYMKNELNFKGNIKKSVLYKSMNRINIEI